MSDSARQHKTPLHHLGALTGIRGIAAWVVVLFHVRVTLVHSLPGWVLAVIAKGYLAVDLFFILSGFVLWYNYGERLQGGGLCRCGQLLVAARGPHLAAACLPAGRVSAAGGGIGHYRARYFGLSAGRIAAACAVDPELGLHPGSLME